MSRAHSIFARRSYGLARICRLWRTARSSVYHERAKQEETPQLPRRRGPQGVCSDEELAGHVRRVLSESPWVGEGYRKVWARLRHEGLRAAPRRVLRVMRENDLLAPQRTQRDRGPQTHDGSIVPERPDELWGTDATSTLTAEGSATIFFVVDHCTAECLGIHSARRGTRFEALEPLRQAVRGCFGSVEVGVAPPGLELRHDHGSQFTSNTYQNELKVVGITPSPAYVKQPQGNGCAERFVRTLKEQLLWIRRFENVDELNAALEAFRLRYNTEWIVARHGWISPAEKRRHLEAAA